MAISQEGEQQQQEQQQKFGSEALVAMSHRSTSGIMAAGTGNGLS